MKRENSTNRVITSRRTGKSLRVLTDEIDPKAIPIEMGNDYVIYPVPSGEEATLYWDCKENIWLAEVSGDILDGYERGYQVFVRGHFEPCMLNHMACTKLLRAYGVPIGTVIPSDVPDMSPAELRAIGGDAVASGKAG